MSIFKKRRRLTKKDLKEIVNNSEDSEYSDDSSQTMIVTFHLRTLVGLFILKVKKDEFSDEEIESDMHHGTWINAGTEMPCFPFIGIQIK